jgi:hypothetical protein
MEISGKIIAVLPQTSGEGRNGTWRSQDFVIETADQYPKKVCLNLFNDKIDQFPVTLNETVTVSFDVESREYNGRWYTNLRAWKVEKQAIQTNQDNPVTETSIPKFEPAAGQDDGTGLPF